MTEQKKRILESVDYLKSKVKIKKLSSFALVTYNNPSFLSEFKIASRFSYAAIPPAFDNGPATGEFIFASHKKSKRDLIILNGHVNYFDGFSMRDSAHLIYVLKEFGIKNIMLIDEVGHLNPRWKVGGVALIYDHINLMGNNPLIGENDVTLGLRFPDMSNAYDEKWTADIEKLLIDRKFRYYTSVYLGVTGPETESEAECRFYREIGADVLGYSLIPENIAAIHSSMNVTAFGIISRELVADRLVEISQEEKRRNRLKAEKSFSPVLFELLGSMK